MSEHSARINALPCISIAPDWRRVPRHRDSSPDEIDRIYQGNNNLFPRPPSIILSPSLPTLHSYKRQVDLLTCVERLADDFWEEHLHAGRLGRRGKRQHIITNVMADRGNNTNIYPLPDTVPSSLPRNSSLQYRHSIPSYKGEFEYRFPPVLVC